MNQNSGGSKGPPGGSKGTDQLSLIPMGLFYMMSFIQLPLMVSFHYQYFPQLIQFLAGLPARRILSARL